MKKKISNDYRKYVNSMKQNKTNDLQIIKCIIFQSVIVPIHNGAQWIDACFHSILKQTALNNPNLRLEVCICNDSSADNTLKLLKNWESDFQEQGVVFKIFNNTNGTPGGGKIRFTISNSQLN